MNNKDRTFQAYEEKGSVPVGSLTADIAQIKGSKGSLRVAEAGNSEDVISGGATQFIVCRAEIK